MGGSEPQPPTIIPAPPPPNVGQNAEDLYSAQARWNPQLTQQAVQSQLQYGPQLAQAQTDIQRQQAPQLAQSQYDIQAQMGPLYRQLYTNMFPGQSAGLDALAAQGAAGVQSPTGLTGPQQAAQTQARQDASGRVSTQYADVLGPQAISQYQNPIGLTPEQQQAQDAIRQRAFQDQARYLNTQANIGGNLYGGNNQLRNDRAYNELSQGFVAQDIDRQAQQRQQALQQLQAAQAMQSGIEGQRQQFGLQDVGLMQQNQQQALQNLIASLQVVFPQVQQPGVAQSQAPNFTQGVVPGADQLLQALVQNSGQFGVIPGQQGTPGFFGSFLNAF